MDFEVFFGRIISLKTFCIRSFSYWYHLTVLPRTESVVCDGSWGAVREEVGCAAGKL